MSPSRGVLRAPRSAPALSHLPIRTLTTIRCLRSIDTPPTVSTSTADPPSPAKPPDAQNTPPSSFRPESPHHIRVPRSAQATLIKTPWPKGTLPVARDIFKRSRGGAEHASQEYLERMYPRRKKPLGSNNEAQASRNAWRQRMADMRRRNLRQGISGLWRRRERRRERLQLKRQQKLEERQELLTRPAEEQDRVTRVSITQEMMAPLAGKGRLPDPNAEERHAAKVANREAHQEAKAADTQDSLHTLYMRARDFIVTEEQLDKEIEKEFGTSDNPRAFKNHAPSIWAEGAPPTLTDLLRRSGQSRVQPESSAEEKTANNARARLMQERMKKVAETLTGGKM